MSARLDVVNIFYDERNRCEYRIGGLCGALATRQLVTVYDDDPEPIYHLTCAKHFNEWRLAFDIDPAGNTAGRATN